jgi:NADH:ubiquinone oxidoreductase subunit K
MSKKKNRQNSQKKSREFIFQRRNYLLMFIGLALIALGYILMAGGGTEDPEVFSEAIFSFRRIRLAPALVLIGLGIQVFAILSNPNKKKSD